MANLYIILYSFYDWVKPQTFSSGGLFRNFSLICCLFMCILCRHYIFLFPFSSICLMIYKQKSHCVSLCLCVCVCAFVSWSFSGWICAISIRLVELSRSSIHMSVRVYSWFGSSNTPSPPWWLALNCLGAIDDCLLLVRFTYMSFVYFHSITVSISSPPPQSHTIFL